MRHNSNTIYGVLYMQRFGIAARITLMAVISFVLLMVVGVVGVVIINGEAQRIRNIHENSLPSIVVIDKARLVLMKMRVDIYQALSFKDDLRAKTLESLQKNEEEARKLLSSYDSLVISAEDRRLLDEEKNALKTYIGALDSKLVPLIKQGQDDQATEFVLKEAGPLGDAVLKAFDAHVDFNEKLADAEVLAAVEAAHTGRNIAIGIAVFSLLVIGGLSITITREVRERLTQMSSFMIHVAETLDFSRRGKIIRMDEFGKVGYAINLLMDKLTASLKSIAENAGAVAAASEQLANGATQVARASSHQSEASSNVAATVEEMTVSINHVGERAREADHLSQQSEKLAQEGGAVILQTATDIHDIADSVRYAAELIESLEASSKQISGVVAVIRDVADQTNLLALNAAIEAARAGEQGRGFAVVADEVRKLAERTGHSTQEIARTIETMNEKASQAVASMNQTVGKVDMGVQRARETSDSIQQISSGCHEAVKTVVEISSAIREQGAATNNIAAQIEKIAQMSEESSAAAGETAEAARGLDDLAHKMLTEVRYYRFN